MTDNAIRLFINKQILGHKHCVEFRGKAADPRSADRYAEIAREAGFTASSSGVFFDISWGPKVSYVTALKVR
jgi:hypothetical protein